MLRHRQLCRDSVSLQLHQIGVATQFVCRDNISVGSCCNNVSCIVDIRDQESLSQQSLVAT